MVCPWRKLEGLHVVEVRDVHLEAQARVLALQAPRRRLARRDPAGREGVPHLRWAIDRAITYYRDIHRYLSSLACLETAQKTIDNSPNCE